MWICHDIGKVCDCTNDNGIVDDNLDHDKDALEYGSEGGSEEDGSDAEESDDEDDDVTWKSDFYCADFSKDTLTKHVPVVQHGDSSLLKFGPSRPKPGQRGPVKHYLCNAVDCGKNANYGPDPLCVSHQREKVEGRTCTGQFRPNKSWSPVKSLLLASEEKYFLDPPNTILKGSKIIAQLEEQYKEGVVDSIDGDDIVVKYDEDGDIEKLPREKVHVKLASYSTSKKSKMVVVPLNGPPSDKEVRDGTRSTAASANSGAEWAEEEVDELYQSITDKVREKDVDPLSEEGQGLVSEAIRLLQEKSAKSKSTMSMSATLAMQPIKRMWRYRDVAMKNCNLSGSHCMLAFDTFVSDMATVLALDRSVVESMVPCDEERWNSTPASRKKHLLDFCLNVVARFQGSCGAGDCNGCGIDFRDMTIKDRRKVDFHHNDESTKLFDLSQAKYYPSFVMIEELRKCVAICSNCHRGETHEQTQAKIQARKRKA